MGARPTRAIHTPPPTISNAILTIQMKNTMKITAGTHSIQLGIRAIIDFFSFDIKAPQNLGKMKSIPPEG